MRFFILLTFLTIHCYLMPAFLFFTLCILSIFEKFISKNQILKQ